eukprot:scaffold98269_cov35-Prasinocladus_malaysianus.AAC.1
MPQRPYMVLGTLRDQLLYPTWAEKELKPGLKVLFGHVRGFLARAAEGDKDEKSEAMSRQVLSGLPVPSDAEMEAVLEQVRLSQVVARLKSASQSEKTIETPIIVRWTVRCHCRSAFINQLTES